LKELLTTQDISEFNQEELLTTQDISEFNQEELLTTQDISEFNQEELTLLASNNVYRSPESGARATTIRSEWYHSFVHAS
jgi:hypothetical protein